MILRFSGPGIMTAAFSLPEMWWPWGPLREPELGAEKETGSIEPGKRADLTLIETESVNYVPGL